MDRTRLVSGNRKEKTQLSTHDKYNAIIESTVRVASSAEFEFHCSRTKHTAVAPIYTLQNALLRELLFNSREVRGVGITERGGTAGRVRFLQGIEQRAA